MSTAHRLKQHFIASYPYYVFALATFVLFRPIILHSDHIVFSLVGDASKNTFTFLYHVLYGSGVRFEGMNYPLGEHVVFTDNQPLLSVTLAALNKWLHFSVPGLLALMHWLIIVSYWVGMVYTYKALRCLSVQKPLAVAVAGCAIVLMPQVFRIDGHFALAYACFLPALFYYNLLYYFQSRGKYLVAMGLLILSFSLIHLYYAALALIWMAGYVGGYFLLYRGPIKSKLRHVLGLVACIMTAVVLAMVVIRMTDPATDRPVLPHSSEAKIEYFRVFTQKISPIWQGISEAGLVEQVKQDTNDPAYIAIPLVLCVFIGIVLWIISKVKRRAAPSSFSPVWHVLALFALLYAIYVPFLWDLDSFKRLLMPLRQFRSPDRLSWITYFILSVYAGVVMSYLLKMNWRQKWTGYGIVITILAIWMIEANGNVIHLGKKSADWERNYEEFFLPDGENWTSFFRKRGIAPSAFQAILALPYVHVGSEKVWVNEDRTRALDISYRASLELQLPIMDVMMSRTAWGETFSQVKIASGLYGAKPMLERLGTKPILIIHYLYDDLTPDERVLLSASKHLGDFEECDLYMFEPGKFLERQKILRQEALNIASVQTVADTVIGDKSWCYIDHFEAGNSSEIFAGEGGLWAVQAEDSLIASWELPEGPFAGALEFSIWVKVPGGNHRSPYMTILCRDSSGKELYRTDALTKKSVDNAPGLWFRVNKYFSLPEGAKVVQVIGHGAKEPTCLAVDELVIRPESATVISRLADGTILANNHVLVSPRPNDGTNNRQLLAKDR